jgi:hypothetical protein
MHWIDPDSLPATTGTIDTLVYNPHGEVDGLVLDGDRLVHLPPHLAARAGRRLKAGEAVEVRAIRPRGAPVLAAVAIDAGGRCFVDDGPEGHHPPAPPPTRDADIVGSVRLTLHAPRGEVCGALLQDGTIVRLHPKGNAALAEYFEPGRRIEVWGPAFRKGGVQVVDVDHVAYIAESEDEAQSFADEQA